MTLPNDSVSIQIAQSDAIALINYLVQQQIPFEMNFLSNRTRGEFSFKEASQHIENPKSTFEKIPHSDSPIIKTVKEIHQKYIVKEIGNIPPPENEIAKIYGIGIMAFKTTFKQIFGSTFYQYYVQKKMEYACQLLKKGHTANEVSAKVGYTHPIKFNKMFQKYIGMTPKQYQVKHYGSRNRRLNKA